MIRIYQKFRFNSNVIYNFSDIESK